MRPLLPLTRLGLAVSAIVQFVVGLVMLFAKPLVDAFFWPPPLEPVPALSLQYHGSLYLACALGAAYALRQDQWPAARTYFAIAAPYIVLSVVLAVLAAATPPGIPPIVWLYVALSLAYLPAVAWVWASESRRAA